MKNMVFVKKPIFSKLTIIMHEMIEIISGFHSYQCKCINGWLSKILKQIAQSEVTFIIVIEMVRYLSQTTYP